jgi:glutamate transport system permease protein
VNSTPVLFDAPGPRARRRTLVASVVAGLVILGGLAWVADRLASRGQFDSVLWQPFTDPDIQHTILIGVLATLKAAGLAIACAVAVGALLAFGRLSTHRLIRWPSTAVVEVARSIPLLLLILALFLAFPRSLGSLGALVLGLTIYNGAVLAEVFRAGLQAVPRGQAEAGYALGLRKHQVMRLVLLPQAVRMMLPALVGQCVVALKDTALGYIITYPELLSAGKSIFNTYFNIIPTAIVVAAIYIAINGSLSALAGFTQRRLGRGRRPRGGRDPLPAAEPETLLVTEAGPR